MKVPGTLLGKQPQHVLLVLTRRRAKVHLPRSHVEALARLGGDTFGTGDPLNSM